MTLLQLCALVPPLCRMAADPDVRLALESISRDPEADRAPLAAAMARHPDDARRAMTLLGCGEPPAPTTLRQRFPREALAFFHLCGQCTPQELLSVLTHCTVTPTAECAALLVGEHRRREAQRMYGLQLLWRITGDASLPDAQTLFPAPSAPHPTAEDVIHHIHHRLKEVAS